MLFSPRVAIMNGWITGNIEEKNIQPNAIDFSLDRLFTINGNEPFVISEEKKIMRCGEELVPSLYDDLRHDDNKSYWKLEPKKVYDGMSNFHVTLPEGIAAMLIVRSTFNRNGVFLTSGLYDSGFNGSIGFAIHNPCGFTFIEPGTRIGQIVFVAADSAKMYDGGWNHEAGTHYTEKEV